MTKSQTVLLDLCGCTMVRQEAFRASTSLRQFCLTYADALHFEIEKICGTRALALPEVEPLFDIATFSKIVQILNQKATIDSFLDFSSLHFPLNPTDANKNHISTKFVRHPTFPSQGRLWSHKQKKCCMPWKLTKINSFDEFTILVVCGVSMVFSNKGNHGGSPVCVFSHIMWKSVTILICVELR